MFLDHLKRNVSGAVHNKFIWISLKRTSLNQFKGNGSGSVHREFLWITSKGMALDQFKGECLWISSQGMRCLWPIRSTHAYHWLVSTIVSNKIAIQLSIPSPLQKKQWSYKRTMVTAQLLSSTKCIVKARVVLAQEWRVYRTDWQL